MRTKEQLLQMFKDKHNDTYEYIVTETKSNSDVGVICKKHGVFYQKVRKHLEGQGCKRCAGEKSSRKWKHLTGFRVGGKQIQLPLYTVWKAMQQRGNPSYWKTHKHYTNTSISDGFRSWDLFYEWAVSQKGCNDIDQNGCVYELDKDLLSQGEKVYSEDTCCFLPREINIALGNKQYHKIPELVLKYKSTLDDRVVIKLEEF